MVARQIVADYNPLQQISVNLGSIPSTAIQSLELRIQGWFNSTMSSRFNFIFIFAIPLAILSLLVSRIDF